MLSVPGYSTAEQIHLGSRAEIFRARRKADQLQVVLKAPRNPLPSHAEVARLQAELRMGQMVEHAGVVRYLELARDDHRPVLVIEDFGGTALSKTLASGPLTMPRFLELAVAMAEALARIHQRGLIHRDINPSNVVHVAGSGQVKIIDFGIAAMAAHASEAAAVSVQQLEGTLRYISPEQTGRMNRSVDHRTDLYSLGVTFFEMLSGQVPFTAQDPLELVHAHLARTPAPLTNLVGGLPQVVATIVARLMAKIPEDRYQSAEGLAKDLRRCREALTPSGTIPSFPLGEDDFGSRFTLPGKLYGRESEADQLLASFERARDGGRVLLSVTGRSGTGKTALLKELQRPVLGRGGWFVRGRFDPQRSDTPHSAFIDVGAELVRQVLTQGENQIAAWRCRLVEALGDSGQVLVNVFPEVELLIGPQPPAAELPRHEAELRFSRLACAFFRLFSGRRHPLVIVLDDLESADPASLKLIELLMAETELHHLLLVGCYRVDALTPSHPLSLMLRAVGEGPADSDRIELGPLGVEQIAALLADTLRVDPGAVEAFAATVHEKTVGNPLFVAQYLTTLHAEGLLHFDPKTPGWRWDEERIAAKEISDDVADLLLTRMSRLPEATRQIIELAACIGRRFDLATLAVLADLPPAEVADALLPAMDSGILRACCAGFGRMVASMAVGEELKLADQIRCEFVHNRFQRAAYARMPTSRRRQLHLRLGRMLHASLDDAALQDRVFEVVHHFEVGIDGLSGSGERLEVARLCLAAGERAFASVAYSTAIRHFEAGVALLPPDRWERHYGLTFALTSQLYGARVLVRADHQEGLALGEELLEQARNLTDRMHVVGHHLVDLARVRRVDEALELGAATLRELGLELLPDDVPRAIAEGRAELERLLGGRDLAQLAELPTMTDPEKLAAVHLVGAMSMPIYMRHRQLLPLQAIAHIRLALEYGNAPGTAMAYCTWGKVLAHGFGDFNRGYELCRIGRRLSDAMGTFRTGTRLLSVAVDWLREPAGDVLDDMRQTFRLGIETGENNFAAIMAAMIPSVAFSAGVPLDALKQESLSYVDFIAEHQGDVGVREIDLALRLVDALCGRRPLDTALFDSEAEAEQALEVMRVRNTEGVVFYHLQRARLALLFGDAREALEHAERAHPFVDWQMGAFASHDLVFVHALALAGCLDQTDPEPVDRADLRTSFEEQAARLQGWVDQGAGVNLRHKALLVSAERCRIQGDHVQVGGAYERAVEAAAATDQIHDQALANELAARHYQSAGLAKVAGVYLQEAHYCYQRWGATAKLEAMEREHPILGQPLGRAPGATTTYADGTTDGTSTSDRAPALDYATVLEASRVISGEVVLSNLLRKLLSIAADNAGAERALLLLRHENALRVEATREPEDEQVRLVDGLLLDECDHISAGVANYVSRTKESVVLADASKEGRFQSDPYITRAKTRSLLCAPLSNQGRLVGLIYLENNLVTGAFTEARLELLELLCSQAAVSIDNASLYAGLEQKVEERTRDLERKNEQLNESLERQQQMQNQLLISEKMASLGNLVAGVAHELNTPIGAVVASVDTASRALEKLWGTTESADSLEDVRAAMPRLFKLLQENHRVIGTAGERVSEIVRTLRNFARLDEAERKPADLHEGLDSTLDLLHHRLKQGIEVVKDYGDLPEVLCYPNQLNQVFMNLLVNAVDAIVLRSDGKTGGTIRIRTWFADDSAHVAISDDGPGIPFDAKERIFDPGFTTKGVGVGTGLGLSICFSIVNKHSGSIEVDSAGGRGSTFTVSIPTGKDD